MRITVIAKTGAKKATVVELKPDYYGVSVSAQPINGRANAAIIKLLAKHFDIAPSTISIVRGANTKIKIIDIAQSTQQMLAIRRMSN